jgi:uncharacterized protein YecE (DUF72 family)
MPDIHVGTSGWNYEVFVERLYPNGTPKRNFLNEYAKRLQTVELNATFYRSFPQSTWQGWYRRTPPDFLWSVKAPRFFTHIRRLDVTAESLDRFWRDTCPLEEKLAVVLFQLPPSLKFDIMLFRSFFDRQPSGARIALEARHPSWHDAQVWNLLKERNISWVISDTAGRYPISILTTADFAYVRLHGPTGLYRGLYGGDQLKEWLETIRQWDIETFLYFDNTDDGSAAIDALDMAELVSATRRSS